jgi:hypothetical protein
VIRFNAEFKVSSCTRVGIPKNKKRGENFWCSFNTGQQLIMCNVVYMGTDDMMQENVLYPCIIELPYGEKFPPYCIQINPELCEPINLDENYNLNVGGETIGASRLLDVIEIVRDDFDIKHHADGTI